MKGSELVLLGDDVSVGAMEHIPVDTNQADLYLVPSADMVSDQVVAGYKEPVHATDASIGNQNQRPHRM